MALIKKNKPYNFNQVSINTYLMDMKGDTVIHVLQNVRTKCSQLSCSNDIFIKLKLLHLVFNEIPQLLKNAWMIQMLLEDFDSASLFSFSKFPWMVLQQPLLLHCFVAQLSKDLAHSADHPILSQKTVYHQDGQGHLP